MTVRAIAAEAKNEVYEARLKDKDQIVEAWKGRAEIAEKQLNLSGAMDRNSQQVQSIDQFRVESCQQQLAKADARIFNLEHPGLLKELFEPKQLVKIGGAFWLGRITAPK